MAPHLVQNLPVALGKLGHRVGDFRSQDISYRTVKMLRREPIPNPNGFEYGWNLLCFPLLNSTYAVSGLKAVTSASRVEGCTAMRTDLGEGGQ